MKFTPGQRVIVLDTENKPARAATVKTYHPEAKRYLLDFKYSNSQEAEEIAIPEERLILKQ